MFDQLRETLLPRIIGPMKRRKVKLNKGEKRAEESFLRTLEEKGSKTKDPIIVAMIGLIGSGKSSVASEFAERIGATIISADAIRIELRKQNEGYDNAWLIAEHVAELMTHRQGNVVIDSDFIDPKKRASIREMARRIGVRLIFVRTVCDIDVMVGRVLQADYRDDPEDFFGGASSRWKGTPQNRGAAVKVREMWRRTPQHYRWMNTGGGRWILKKLPFTIFATIDTTDEKLWKDDVKTHASRLLV